MLNRVLNDEVVSGDGDGALYRLGDVGKSVCRAYPAILERHVGIHRIRRSPFRLQGPEECLTRAMTGKS